MNLMMGDGDGLSQIGLMGGVSFDSGPSWGGENLILGPDGNPVDTSSTTQSQDSTADELRRLRDEISSLKSGYDRQVRHLQTELESTRKQFQSRVESAPVPAAQEQSDEEWNRQAAWWGFDPAVVGRDQEPPTPQQHQQKESDMTPEELDRILAERERKQADAYMERRRKEEEATKQFLSNPQLKPWMNDALREYQFLQNLAPNAPVETHLQTVLAKINSNIAAGLRPQQPYDDKQVQGGGIPGQRAGSAMVGDNRFRPDEQGSVLGYYSDEQRRADAAEDIRARQMDLDYRKNAPYGGSGTTYEEFYAKKSR